MNVDFIKQKIALVAQKYPIKSVTLFGSCANETATADSDIDLIIEFSEQITLLTISKIKYELEDELSLSVDIVHDPITKDDLIEVGKTVELYAA